MKNYIPENKLKSKDVTYGGWIQCSSIAITEIMASSNKFDWICIDLEHGSISIESLPGMINTILLHKTIPVVRVPKNEYKWIGRSLDAGAMGIIVPMINNKEDAEYAVDCVKYPPKGNRGFGYSHCNNYGHTFESYIKYANEEIALIVQIEHCDAMTNLREILSVDGVDGSFLGPLDLKGSIDINMDDILFKDWMDKYLNI
ncbi:hypothetical protein LCGC14_2965290 [marine sediment metagenome]|uniref:HpcH/HpaI aldolase/citrate lyase domain-containing protein n=1 Tax=marine sediment metagenome TaxID=412755 RepID=A0A0F8ZIR8_9ZZZZ